MLPKIWINKLFNLRFIPRSIATFLLVGLHGKCHWLGANKFNTVGYVRSRA